MTSIVRRTVEDWGFEEVTSLQAWDINGIWEAITLYSNPSAYGNSSRTGDHA
jgi:hypothetical protein